MFLPCAAIGLSEATRVKCESSGRHREGLVSGSGGGGGSGGLQRSRVSPLCLNLHLIKSSTTQAISPVPTRQSLWETEASLMSSATDRRAQFLKLKYSPTENNTHTHTHRQTPPPYTHIPYW